MKYPQTTSETLNKVETLDALFALRVRQTPQGDAYRQFDAASGKWVGHTWDQIAARVEALCHAIETLRLPHGARVAILLPNSVNAICADQASLALGLVPVPMHAIDNPASIGYILNDCQASMLVLSTTRNGGQLSRLARRCRISSWSCWRMMARTARTAAALPTHLSRRGCAPCRSGCLLPLPRLSAVRRCPAPWLRKIWRRSSIPPARPGSRRG